MPHLDLAQCDTAWKSARSDPHVPSLGARLEDRLRHLAIKSSLKDNYYGIGKWDVCEDVCISTVGPDENAATFGVDNCEIS